MRAALGRAGRGAALGLIACLAAALAPGCGAVQRPAEQAQVRFLLEPADARVYVDDRFLGAGRVLARRPRNFPAGRRHFTVAAEGYFPHDVEVDLPSGLTTIRLSLRPVPP